MIALNLRRAVAASLLVFCTALIATTSFSVAPGARGLFGGALGMLMFAIAIVDARRYIIPNELTLAAFLLAWLYQGIAAPNAGLNIAMYAAIRGILAAAPFYLLMVGYRFYRGRDGLGLGDVKLMIVAGAWLNWLTIAGVVESAALAAIAFHLIAAYRAGHKLSATKSIPFGMFLAPAIWLGWLADRTLF
jgi:leader peptidase (prepilin peptidase) / N-methyltransferase